MTVTILVPKNVLNSSSLTGAPRCFRAKITPAAARNRLFDVNQRFQNSELSLFSPDLYGEAGVEERLSTWESDFKKWATSTKLVDNQNLKEFLKEPEPNYLCKFFFRVLSNNEKWVLFWHVF